MADYPLGTTIYIPFETLYANTMTTLSGGTLAVWADNNTTQFTSGLTLTADFDSVTGLNLVTIVATSGNTYATNTDYSLRLTAGTVNGVSAVGRIVGTFSIEKESALRPATALRTIVVDAAGLADANTVKVGPTGAGTAQTARDLGLNIDTTISSRSTYAGGAVASVTAGVTVTTNNDKTGYALTAPYDPAKTAAQEPQGIKKNTALAAFTFPIANSTDHITPQTGLTVTPTRSIDGGAFGACTNAVTEIGATGYYKIDFAAADLNGDIIAFKMSPSAGGDLRTFTVRTVA